MTDWLILNWWWVSATLKEIYYRYFPVPESYLEWIHAKVEEYSEDHMEFRVKDKDGEVFNMFRENYLAMHGVNLSDHDDDLELLYNRGYGLPDGYDEKLCIDSCLFTEHEIDLHHCDEWLTMTPTEHEAYGEWCKRERHNVPDDQGLIYISGVNSITLQWKEGKKPQWAMAHTNL